jgi:hypothetical protein
MVADMHNVTVEAQQASHVDRIPADETPSSMSYIMSADMFKGAVGVMAMR